MSRGNDTQGAAVPPCANGGVAGEAAAAAARAVAGPQSATRVNDRPAAAQEVTAPSVSVHAAIDALSARAAGENFPVALRVLPRAYRRHLMAVYRFARLVDDIGDEASAVRDGRAPVDSADAAGMTESADLTNDRLRALGAVEDDLDRAFSPVATSRPATSPAATSPAATSPAATSRGRTSPGASLPGEAPRIAVVRELARTAAECAIPAEPFRMLIQANRQDQMVSRYATFEDLLGYCELSANPVGRIVLHVFGAATPERERLSDLVCTALQLAEHWQDVAEDFARGRVYLPQEDLAAFGCTERDLEPAAHAAHGTAAVNHTSAVHTVHSSGYVAPPRVRELMRFETERAGRLLDEGAALTGTLHGWARLAVAGYVAGGRATLAAIAAAGVAGPGRSARHGNSVSSGRSAPSAGPAGFDVLGATPGPGRARTAAGLIRAYLTGR